MAGMIPNIQEMMSLFRDCTLCPRACHVDRTAGQTGRCRMADRIMAARAALHYWEEPCISGKRGSGTVFFSGCSLGCVYCQNREISGGKAGKEISPQRLAEIFLELQQQGAHNINLVTGAHFAPLIVWSLYTARKKGLNIPIVYNSGGYESLDTLRLLDGLADIYLPDMKYADSALAGQLSGAADYPDTALQAIQEMVRQTGPPVFNEEGMLIKGTLVRHLVLPGHTRDSIHVLQRLHRTFGNRIGISILGQYTPSDSPVLKEKALARKLTGREYTKVLNAALDMGIEQGFYQEGETALESFIPPFDNQGI